MEAISAFFAGKLAWVIGGLGVMALFPLIRKALGKFVSKQVGSQLGKLLDPNTSDPKEKELIRDAVLALVKLAEYKIPDKGMGREKYEAVAHSLVKMIPILSKYEDKIAELIEEAVNKMDEELKKASE